MSDFITVQSSYKDDTVALWERHPDHPEGEVFIVGSDAVKVARTPEVEKRLKDGVLVEVRATKTPDKAESATEDQPDVVPEPKAKTVKKG